MGVKNKLTDVHDLLVAQLEALSGEDLTPDELDQEVKRSKAMVGVARAITANANTLKDMVKIQVEYGKGAIDAPEILQITEKEDNKK